MTSDAQTTLLATLSRKYTTVSVSIVDTIIDLARLVEQKPDLVVLGMKLVLLEPEKGYDTSLKVWLSSYLLGCNILFTGSGTDALKVEYDKPVAKQRVLDSGLKTAAFFVSSLQSPTFSHNLTYPLFVKPTNRGDSKGIDDSSIVTSQKSLESKIRSIHDDYDSDALIEEYLEGREFSVAVVASGTIERPFYVMPIEISAPENSSGQRFLSEKIKNGDKESVIAVTNDALRSAVNELAIGVFESLGSRDYGRIDMRLDQFGVPNFIESNLMPGLSDHGYLSRCFKMNENIDYEEMVYFLVNSALRRADILDSQIQ